MSKKSANKSPEILYVNLGVSRSLLAAFILLHVGALALLYPIDVPWPVRVGLAILLGMSLHRTITQHGLRSASSAVTQLRWSDGDGLELGSRHEEGLRAATVTGRFVHRWLVLLSVRVAGRRLTQPVAIAADTLDAESFRRLRAALLAAPRTPAV